MYHKGKFTDIKHPDKYVGDIRNITYRSHWERNVMRWLDNNNDVIEWASEEVSIPYQHPIYNRRAKYYPDFFMKFKDGKIKIIEVKPKEQTEKPMQNKSKRMTKKYVHEMMVWAVNCEKWDAALKYGEQFNYKFEVWTQDTLKEMGILNWETDKTVLLAERTASNKPKLQSIFKAKKKYKTSISRNKRPRPKRKS
jgi:hypothetical protein